MQRKRYAVLSVVMVLVVLVAYVLGTQLIAPHLFYSANNQNIGANVTVTGPKVPRAMKAIKVAITSPFNDQLQPFDKSIDVTPSGPLPAPVTLRFKLDSQVRSGEVLVIATSESPKGPWTLMQPTISSDGWYASVQATHLSLITFGKLIVSKIKDFLKSFIAGLTGDLFTAASPPHCDHDIYHDPTLKQEGYSTSWASQALSNPLTTSSIYWCFGIESNQPTLKVVNKLRYPIEVIHSGLTFLRGNAIHAELDQLARIGSGPDTILFPFQEADYAVNTPAGGSVGVRTDFANLAEGLAIFQTAVSVVLAIAAFTSRAVISAAQLTVTVVEDSEATTVAVSASMTVDVESLLINVTNWLINTLPDCFNAAKKLDIGGILGTCFQGKVLASLFGDLIGGIVGIVLGPVAGVAGFIEYARDSFNNAAGYDVGISRAASTPTQPPSPPTQPPSPPQPVDAYNNYGTYNGSYPMCRGNINYSPSQPGGTVSQTFTVPSGVATLSGAEVQIDPDSRVTAHLSIVRNGTVVATTSSAAAGDTYFTYGPVSVSAGDTITLSITFTATYGSIITVYSAGSPGGTFSVSNSCASSSTNVTSTSVGLRAVVSGMS